MKNIAMIIVLFLSAPAANAQFAFEQNLKCLCRSAIYDIAYMAEEDTFLKSIMRITQYDWEAAAPGLPDMIRGHVVNSGSRLPRDLSNMTTEDVGVMEGRFATEGRLPYNYSGGRKYINHIFCRALHGTGTPYEIGVIYMDVISGAIVRNIERAALVTDAVVNDLNERKCRSAASRRR